jgi:hypothetical protein
MPPVREHKNPRVELLADGKRAEELLEQLLSQVRLGNPGDAFATWRTFVPALLAHLDAEEMYVLPSFENEDRVEHDRLHVEHAKVRRGLGEISVAFELRTARTGPLESFRTLLQDLAAREDGILYEYAERRLPIATVKALVAHLRPAAPPTTGQAV